MVRRSLALEQLTSSACADEREKVSVSKRRVSDFGQEVVRPAAAGTSRRGSGPQVDAERLRRLALEDAPARAAARARRRSPASGASPATRCAVVGRVEADERASRTAAPSVSAPAKMRSCPRSVGGRRREPHLAAAEQHQPGHAVVALDREDRALVERQHEILRRRSSDRAPRTASSVSSRSR